MRYNVGDIIPFEQIQEATDYVNSIDGCYYLEDYQKDKQGRMMLIVRQLPIYIPTEAEIQDQLEKGIEAWMNTVVAEKHYDSIDTCIARYTDSPNPKYAAEAKAVKDWNTEVWDKCWGILAEVKAGTRGIPTLEEVIAELPKLVW